MRRGAGVGDEPVLAVEGLEVCYQAGAAALRGVTLSVPAGGALAVVGPNGAGKTTLLRAVSGLLWLHGGRVTAGRALVRGVEVAGRDRRHHHGRPRGRHRGPAAVVRLGVAQVMEGRRVFADLSVDDNLRAGAFTRHDRVQTKADLGRVFDLFPDLGRRRSTPAGYLSGGEQQMLAVARALMAAPSLLLLDEPSLGLAPAVVSQVRDALAEVNRAGTALVVVEQRAALALALAPEGCLLERGEVVAQAPSADLAADPRVRSLQLGAPV